MSRVLVTGGFGFVGTRLVRHLRSQGVEVLVLEHPATPVPKGLEDLEVLRADITDEASVAAARARDVDAVMHLAAQSSGPRSFSVPLLDVRLNIVGTLNIIDWCVQNQVERLIFASSFVVYGDHPDREVLDESVACRPKSVYATSKLACEHLMMNYAQPKGIRWNALRMFNVYGPGQDITKPDQGVAGIFMNMLMKADVVQVKGSLQRFRDLVFIDDVLAAWEACLRRGTPNRIYNLGSGRKTTFTQLIESIADTLGKRDRLRIEELPGTPGDMMGCYADMSSCERELGFTARVELREGLKRMYEWVLANRPVTP